MSLPACHNAHVIAHAQHLIRNLPVGDSIKLQLSFPRTEALYVTHRHYEHIALTN